MSFKLVIVQIFYERKCHMVILVMEFNLLKAPHYIPERFGIHFDFALFICPSVRLDMFVRNTTELIVDGIKHRLTKLFNIISLSVVRIRLKLS